MSAAERKSGSPAMVILAFAIVYIVWGSTYFFIQKAIEDLPPLILGAMRFLLSGSLLFAWCWFKGERLWDWTQVKVAAITGLLLLLIGNGAVIWTEKTLPSSLVAVLASSSPLWFILLDRQKWKENFSTTSTLFGLFIGFIGVFLLFSEQVGAAISGSGNSIHLLSLLIIVIGSIAWAGGSLYSKYHAKGSTLIGSAWQMLVAGLAFLPLSLLSGEWNGFHASSVSTGSWTAMLYLVFMGSLLGYSAYIWLLQVRPAAQVSTYAYVNPVVAVLLGTFFADEHMSFWQILGLVVILLSVLLVNLSKYKSGNRPPVSSTNDFSINSAKQPN